MYKNKIIRNPNQKNFLLKNQRVFKTEPQKIYTEAISGVNGIPYDEPTTFRTKTFSHQKDFQAIALISKKSYFLTNNKKDIYIINHLPILLRSGFKNLKKNARNLIRRNLDLSQENN